VVERARIRAEAPKPLLTAEYTDANPKPSKPSAIVLPGAAADESGLSSQVQAQLTNLVGWSDDFRRFNQFSVERKLRADPTTCATEEKPDKACPDAVRMARAKGDVIHPPDIISVALLWWIWWLVTQHLVGWALTVVAISLGAPFWFDALKGLVNLRAAGKPPQPSEKSEPSAEGTGIASRAGGAAPPPRRQSEPSSESKAPEK
jgi:hypothetical protein